MKKKNTKIIEANLKNIFIKIFKLKNKVNLKDLHYKKISNWDSLQHILLIKSIEKKFKLEFNDTEIIDMISYKNILNKIKNFK
tara:strand:+ start:25 stop:273 length:249 start_codon:yes stop_codon:yes gene_type:complete